MAKSEYVVRRDRNNSPYYRPSDLGIVVKEGMVMSQLLMMAESKSGLRLQPACNRRNELIALNRLSPVTELDMKYRSVDHTWMNDYLIVPTYELVLSYSEV